MKTPSLSQSNLHLQPTLFLGSRKHPNALGLSQRLGEVNYDIEFSARPNTRDHQRVLLLSILSGTDADVYILTKLIEQAIRSGDSLLELNAYLRNSPENSIRDTYTHLHTEYHRLVYSPEVSKHYRTQAPGRDHTYVFTSEEVHDTPARIEHGLIGNDQWIASHLGTAAFLPKTEYLERLKNHRDSNLYLGTF